MPRINPIVKPFVDLFPLPNSPNDEYRFLYTQPTDEYFVQGKVDLNLSAKDSLFVRWTHNKSERTEVTSSPDFERLGFSRAHYTTLSHNRVISPTLVNTARASYSFTRLGIDPDCQVHRPAVFHDAGSDAGRHQPGAGPVAALAAIPRSSSMVSIPSP